MQLIENKTSILNPSILTQLWAIADEFVNTVEEQNKQVPKKVRLTGPQKASRVIDLFEELFLLFYF